MTSAAIARAGLAFLFVYHGLVPKILWVSTGERAMIRAHGFEGSVDALAQATGVVEIAIGVAIAAMPRRREPLYVAIAALVALLVDTGIFSPERLIQAFGHVSTNVAGIALAGVALRHTPRPRDGAS